ncbi:MAG: amidohydrolase family protein, partial [Salinigranum sp.]
SKFVRVGAIKTFTDGSIGGRTARLSEPYDDWPDAGDESAGRDSRGEWVVAPDDLRDLVVRADEAGFQVAAHAIGDEAV